MRILVIISSNEFLQCKELRENIIILRNYMKDLPYRVDYAGISSKDDFENYEDIIEFKFKMINPKKQLSKMCDFIKENRGQLNYDWYIKIRPEIMLMEQIPFDTLMSNSINARARQYTGPKKVINGMSVGGEGCWNHVKPSVYNPTETNIELDDQIYIFDDNCIKMGAFDNYNYQDVIENEAIHDAFWKSKNVKLNLIGIDAVFKYCKYGTFARSGNT
jgi:hypothetical protein